MKREELLRIAKPILFNGKMVRALMDSRKIVTRRLVKEGAESTPEYHGRDKLYGIVDHLNNDHKHYYAGFYNESDIFYVNGNKNIDAIYFKAPYKPDDIIYVRETWCKGKIEIGEEPDGREALYISQCTGEGDYIHKEYAVRRDIGMEGVAWKPSIHMPKEAARIFLQVKNIRVEKLQDISHEDVLREGIKECPGRIENGDDCACAEIEFITLWDSTIKKSDLEKYGWEANPYVWVIEFECLKVD